MASRIPRLLPRSPISETQLNFAGTLGFACTIPGTCLCFLVLVAYGIASFYPKAREHLDRVSFRLLVYTLIFNVLYGIAFSVTAAQTGPGALCNFGAFAVNFTLFLATFFTTCIALNLQLVLVHRVNGKKMEKYYVAGTILLTLALTVPTYALDQFGFDQDSDTCWFKNPDDHVRLQWLIGTQSFWVALAATIETTCSCVVLYWMFRFQKITRYLQRTSQVSHNISTGGATTRNTHRTWDTSSSSTKVIGQAYKYRSVILRIALYPIISLMVNFSTVALDLNSTIVGTTDEFQYRLLVLDLILYGFRTAVYAVLAAYDPGFIKAVREIRAPKGWSTGNTGRTVSHPRFASGSQNARGTDSTSPENLTVNIEFEMATHSDAMDSKFSKDDSNFNSSRGTLKDPDIPRSGRLQARMDEANIRFTQSEVELEDDRKFGQQL